MENKNFFVAMILCAGFLLLWSFFVMPRFMPKTPGGVPAPTAAQSANAPAPTATLNTPAAAAASASAKPGVEFILRNADNEIVFSSKGGGILHWRLTEKGQEIDLVEKPDVSPIPLATFGEAPFTAQILKDSAILSAKLDNGLRVKKTLTLAPEGHLHQLSFVLTNPTARPIELKDFSWGWGPGLGTTKTELKENSGMIRAISMGKLKSHVVKPGSTSDFGLWSAIDNRYFLVAFLPSPPAQPSFNVTGAKELTTVQVTQSLTVPPNGEIRLPYQIYVGPKGYTQLMKYHKDLQAAVDFGMFSGLGKVILRAVYWLQRQTGNYGWAIIALTIILQVMLLPLTLKSFKATLAMKRLQPQIAAIQAAYKSDPKRLQVEMMNVYKKSGTNPLGGCLPMLLQMPIFWALFTTLRNAYELRGAPFIGWIHDLSAADPFHVLPVLMGAGMFVQQRMAGAVTDPTQRQMMYIFPIMMTVMFFNFPAGLVLYWFTQSLITLMIQWIMMRRQSPSTPTLELVK